MSSIRRLGFAIAFVTCSACGGGSGLGKPVATFPSAEDVEEVASETVAPKLSYKTVEVDRWQIDPASMARGKGPASTHWDKVLADVVSRRSGHAVIAPELSCAAQETARFYVEHDAYPSQGLQQYLVGRCGGVLPGPQIAVFGGAVPDDVSQERIEREFLEKLPAFVQSALPAGLGQIGIGFARGKGRAAVIVYSGQQRARLDRFSPLVAGPQTILEGEAPQDAVFGLALATQGANGVALCEPDRAVRSPRFRFVCPFAEADALSRIEIATRKAGQVLLTPVLTVLVRRTDEAGLTYEPSTFGVADAPAADAATFQRSLLGALNTLRKEAGLRALALEENQSKLATSIAPHWFDASFSNDPQRTELVALGLMAGWRVPGIIRDGGIYSGFLVGTRNPGRWLGHALEGPLGRWVLLEPDVSRVAIGASTFADKGVLALVTTYAFFESNDHTADENAVFEELSRVRAARGLPAPKRSAKPMALKTALSNISRNTWSTETAMDETLVAVSTSEQRAVTGWIVETSDLKQLLWSDDVFQPGPLEVSVGVTHYKAEGAAWGQYAVLLVARKESGPAVQTASAPTRKARF